MINAIKEEIQRQLQESEERLSHIKARGWVAPNEEQLIVHLKSLLSFIDTLEVKWVDLNEEIDRVWDNTSDNFSEDGWKEFEDIAKHFFELGFKAQKGEKV